MSHLPIDDEFTNLKISRQRRYQLRMQKEHRCIICGARAEGSKCVKHLVSARERMRRQKRLKHRYVTTLSYQLERKLVTTENQKTGNVCFVTESLEKKLQNKTLSRQRRYQLRMRLEKRCTDCGKPAPGASRCVSCLNKTRERLRKRNMYKRRYINSLGYRLAGEK